MNNMHCIMHDVEIFVVMSTFFVDDECTESLGVIFLSNHLVRPFVTDWAIVWVN